MGIEIIETIPIEYMDEDILVPRLEQVVFPLINELKDEHVGSRLDAVNKLDIIVNALGAERTRNELVPYLCEMMDDEEQVLYAMAEQLPKLVGGVGGTEYAHILLQPLEAIAAVEESYIRDKAVESMCTIIKTLSLDQLLNHVFPLLLRLCQGEWFTSRSSAAGMFPMIFSLSCSLDNNQNIELKRLFTGLVYDSSPIVRRAATKTLSSLVVQLSSKDLFKEGLEWFTMLAHDDQDSVRVLSVLGLIQMAKLMDDQQKMAHLYPIFERLSSDSSWRIKYMLVSKYVQVSQAFGNPIVRNYFISPFEKLMSDSESEVRTAAASQIPGFSSFLEQSEIIMYIIPFAQLLAEDRNRHTRAALAKEISSMSALLGDEGTKEHLIPVFAQLITDEYPDVRLNVISKLDKVNQVIGSESLSKSLIPAITELSHDKQWRTRLRLVEIMPSIANQLGQEIFDKHLSSLCISWLRDSVYTIRKAATINLQCLTQLFGTNWAKATIIINVIEMATENSSRRITTLFALTTIAEVLSPKDINDSILPTILHLGKDPIPNIRLNVAKSLESLTPLLKHMPSIYNTSVKPLLQTLAEDDLDGDVKFFATRAIEHGDAFIHLRPNL